MPGHHHKAFANHQRGVALLVFLALVLMAASYALLKRLNASTVQVARQSDDRALLGEARSALLGYALASTTRPGELPCPDSDGDGLSDGAGPCAGYVGRLPWQTLGLAELRDSAGEQLWYVLDAAFDSSAAINSDSLATLTLDGGATPMVAIVFAPGAALNGQGRSVAQQQNVARYLEDDNADADVNFVSQSANDFNDLVLGIPQDTFLQAIERRVLQEWVSRLNDYYSANNYYPHAAALNTTTCDSSQTQGLLPQAIAAGCPGEADWVARPDWPAWFWADGWNNQLWYAPAPACTQATPNCSGAPFVVLDGSDESGLLLSAGAARLPAQNRSPSDDVNDLLDSVENTNSDLVFNTVPLDAANNDQIRALIP